LTLSARSNLIGCRGRQYPGPTSTRRRSNAKTGCNNIANKSPSDFCVIRVEECTYLRRGRAPLQLVRPYPERAGRCGGGAVRPQGNFVGRHRQRVGDDHHRTDRPLRRLRCTGDYVYVKRGRHLSDKSEQQIAKANGAKFTDFGCIWLGSRGWECCFTSTPGTVNRLPGGGECEGKGSEHCLSTRTGGTDKYCGERGSPSEG
jgi:hypothetical protein